MKRRWALFCDLDGTLVHFRHEVEAYATIEPIPGQGPSSPNVIYTDRATQEKRRCYTVPSSSSGPAYISVQTHTLLQRLRAAGVLVAIVTAGRKSTLLARIPTLPVADVYVGESGSRVLLHPAGALGVGPPADPLTSSPPDQASLLVDLEWAARFVAVTGPLDAPEPPAARPGALWDVFRSLTLRGLQPDGASYWGCFRVDPSQATVPVAEAETAVREVCATLPPTVTYASNLGKVDFYPSASGKGNAVEYILTKAGLQREHGVAMFDDDNDLPMANALGHGLVVRMLTPSVEVAVRANPHWKVATQRGVLATEELLEGLLERVGPAPAPVSWAGRPDPQEGEEDDGG